MIDSRMTLMRVAWLAALVVALSAGPAGAQSLYWLDTNFGTPTLNKADANGVAVASVALDQGSLPEGLAVDAAGNLYWTEAAWSNARLQLAASDLSFSTPIVSGGSAFRGVAADPMDQRVYWTSSNLIAGAKVHRAAFGGGGAVTLISLAPGANPRGIAVDHGAARIYWADFDLNGIFRANLDGSGPMMWQLLPVGCGPYGVAVDPVGGFVYWTEYNTGSLRRVSTLGTGLTTLVSGLANPTYLALDVAGGRMYWAEGGAGAQHIRRATLSGGGVVTLPPPLTTYGGLAFSSVGTTATPEIEPPPVEFALDRLWPSPSGGPVHVSFALPRDARARLGVLDLQGREVAVLADGVVPAGRHERVWDGRSRGGAAPAGIYFVRFAVDGRTWVRRIVLAR
jgi:streptogramin lyase